MFVRLASLPLLLALLATPALACAVPWDEAKHLVQASATFDGVGKLDVVLTRQPGVAGRLHISLPAGTWGAPSGVDPGTYQDLIMLRAPDVYLAAGQTELRVSVPIACGIYGAPTPPKACRFDLKRFEAGSPMQRLLEVLCSRDDEPEPSVAQLAVWIVRNDLKRLAGWETTFGEVERPIRPQQHAAGAVALLTEAGLQTERYAFFSPRQTMTAAPAATTAPAQPARPAPQPAPTGLTAQP
jgi:hypothetical protein